MRAAVDEAGGGGNAGECTERSTCPLQKREADRSQSEAVSKNVRCNLFITTVFHIQMVPPLCLSLPPAPSPPRDIQPSVFLLKRRRVNGHSSAHRGKGPLRQCGRNLERCCTLISIPIQHPCDSISHEVWQRPGCLPERTQHNSISPMGHHASLSVASRAAISVIHI